MKKVLGVLITGLLLLTISSVALAVPVQSETPILNPASTENLWAYSYQENATYITSARTDWVRAGDPYTSAVFQGYVTGASGNWSPANDSFNSSGYSDYRTVHVFDTYITSSIDQIVTFKAGGDDGHSIFIDDSFMAGAGYSYTAIANLSMVANTQYKLTFIGDNYSGPYGWWFNMSGDGWGGPVSAASYVSMDATAGPAPVPEPSTILLLGGRRTIKKKNRRKRR